MTPVYALEVYGPQWPNLLYMSYTCTVRFRMTMPVVSLPKVSRSTSYCKLSLNGLLAVRTCEQIATSRVTLMPEPEYKREHGSSAVALHCIDRRRSRKCRFAWYVECRSGPELDHSVLPHLLSVCERGIHPLSLLDDRDDVLVCKLMRQSDSLRLMLDTLSVDNRNPEVIHNGLVDRVTEVFDSARRAPKNNWRSVIWLLALRFSVDSTKIELLPHLLEQLVHIPTVL